MLQVVFEDNFVFLVMEVANGGSGYDLVSSGKPVAEDRARYMFKQMVSAMDYCHNRKIYHRVRCRPARPAPAPTNARRGARNPVRKLRAEPGDRPHFARVQWCLPHGHGPSCASRPATHRT